MQFSLDINQYEAIKILEYVAERCNNSDPHVFDLNLALGRKLNESFSSQFESIDKNYFLAILDKGRQSNAR